MMTRPEQIGAFDPAFELERVAKLVAGNGQAVVPAGFEWALPVRGYAARSMIARNSPVFPQLHARTIPILEARDAFGRPRGPVGSIAFLFDGPYRGSAWAFFGVTSHDLFAADSPKAAEMASVFGNVVDALIARCFLYGLRSDQACYHDERQVTLAVHVANYGTRPVSVTLRFAIDGGAERSLPVDLDTGQDRRIEVRFDRPAREGNPQRFTAALLIGGRIVDCLDAAYVPWRPEELANGPRLAFAENTFRLDGHPAFLAGTNTTGAMFYSMDEGPLTWDRDLADMADAGIRLLRILHFSPFAHRGYEGEAAHKAMHLAERPPERLIRQTDAIVQLAQKHGVAIFLTLHDWLSCALSEEELGAQRRWARFWASRYRGVPGLLFDIQNEPNARPAGEPTIPGLWESYLAGLHGSLDNAWKAWGRDAPRPQSMPRPSDKPIDWADLCARDWDRFTHHLLERWLRPNADGIREGDPDRLFTIGLLQSPGIGDPAIAARAVRFSNGHYYGNPHDLAAQLKLLDRRAFGKGLTLGEFGSIAMHDRRTHGGDGVAPRESIDHYLDVGHYALGLGAGFVCNWSFKDFAGTVFPWGIRHVGQGEPVPKDLMLAYRNFAMLVGPLEPVDRRPELALLLPDGNRFGACAGLMKNALYASMSALIRLGVPFDVINEEDLATARMPTKAILWPCPYSCDDKAFEHVVGFVRGGGHLYVSGSVGFSADRKPTRADRAGILGIRDMSMAPPWPTSAPAAPREPIRSSAGKGQVYYVPTPIETREPDRLVETYRAFLDAVPIQRAGVTPDDAADSVLRVPTEKGEVLVIVRRKDADKTFTATTGGVRLTLALRGRAPAMVWVESGVIRAAGLKGSLAVLDAGGLPQEILRCTGLAAVMAVCLDGSPADLRNAQARLILPFEAGRVSVACKSLPPDPRILLGDFHGRAWRTLGTEALPSPGDRLDLAINEDTYLDLRLACPADKIEAATAEVRRQVLRRP